VVRFYEFYQDEKNYYMVQEYCRGGDLLTKITDQKFFTDKMASRIINQILSAVEYCHSSKIVHRDMKPENVVFDGPNMDSTVKIIDFGRSKILQPKMVISDKAGTVYYIAPEILLKKPYNEKCDIWSCGVIMYLMLCGHPPFYSQSREEVFKLITSGNVDYSGTIY